MPSFNHDPLTEMVQISNTVGAVYTNPASTKSYIKGLMAHNTNSTTETVEVYWVPDSGGSVGTAADANKIAKLIIPAGDTQFIHFDFPVILKDTNDTIQCSSTSINKVNIAVMGSKYA